MTEPTPDPTAASLCTALMAALPERVLDEPRRTVEPGRFTAAWGDPTITLRCGVAKPPTLTDSSSCFEVNGVGWFAEEASGGYLFTTIGREVFVEVGVPREYAPEAGALVDVAQPITDHDPQRQPCV